MSMENISDIHHQTILIQWGAVIAQSNIMTAYSVAAAKMEYKSGYQLTIDTTYPGSHVVDKLWGVYCEYLNSLALGDVAAILKV